jgi:primosomal protein N' (replication factor Y)
VTSSRAEAGSEQLELLGQPTPRRPTARQTSDPVAEDRPVARVLLDVSLPHLDRPFDYHVASSMAGDAVPGARVAVRFAGVEHTGFIVERTDSSDHTGRLARLRRVVSSESVLAPDVFQLAQAVAARYAGTVADVIRLAVPPRHARTEKVTSGAAPTQPQAPDSGDWARHADGEALLRALASGGAPRAVWSPGPAADWPDLLARLVVATLSGGRGAVIVVPDARDAERVDAALARLADDDPQHVVLTADLGPSERYRRWLAVRRGAVRAVVGTRSAMFAPVGDLGLVAIWDDGDDLHAEPRAPYPHAREVLLLRAHQQGAAAVVGGFARTAEAEQLVATGWAREVVPSRADVRSLAPRIRTSGDDYEQARDAAARTARLPSLAWRTAREALQRGPVLVQVPRAGYVPSLACGRCRTVARCPACHGPMRLPDRASDPLCAWCGGAGQSSAWSCPSCGSSTVRAVSMGAGRTAEELGRAFPGVPVRVSRGQSVLASVDDSPALVVATPGAEPVARGGYAAALLLDGQAMLSRSDLRAAEEALRRWFGVAALVRPGPAGGEVVIVADPSAPAVQALVRWDPAGFARHELADRAQLGFPPVKRVAELVGSAADVADLQRLLELPSGTELLGPVPAGHDERLILRAPRSAGLKLASAVKAVQGVRSARRTGAAVRVRIDPVDLG